MRLEVWTIRGRVFHFGRQAGLGMEDSAVTWPSDSLFAALVARLAAREGPQAVEQAVAPFLDGDPPFLLTSTFPCLHVEPETPLLFFPVPLAALHPRGSGLPAGVQAKDLKKVRFVSEGLFRQLLTGRSLAEVYPKARPAGQKTLLLAAEDWARLPRAWQHEGEALLLWKVEKRPRVTVGRLSNRSNLFHVAGVHFRQDRRAWAGLWFGVHWRHEDPFWAARFTALLDDLGSAGLGAERSVGYGAAEIRSGSSLELPAPEGQGLWTTLSRYRPRREEMPALLADRAAYELITVGGWVDGVGQRRRPLNLVAEGAVLASLGQERPYGTVTDVRPSYALDPDPLSHPVYRYGYALAVGYGGAA